jgi:hypothetical protein
VVNKCEFLLTKSAFYVITACLIAFSVALESYMFVSYKIAAIDYPNGQIGNQTTYYTYYYSAWNDFHKSDTFKIVDSILQSFIALFRDLVLGIVLIIINILILLEIKQVTQRRIFLTTDGLTTSPPTTSQSVRVSLQAERRKSFMTIATGINFLLGHSLYAANHLGLVIDSKVYLFDQWICFNYIAFWLFKISYTNSFFFYYFLTYI